MQFSKIASVAILFVLSFLSLAMASPVARSTETDVEAIVTSLKATISPNIANINAIAKQNPLTFGDAAPDVIAITNAINNAKADLDALSVDASGKRQFDLGVLSSLIAGLLIEVTTTINQIATSPLIVVLLPGLDIALAGLLRSLEGLLAGVLTLVATLLVGVAGIVQSLALGLTLAALGL